MISPAKVGRSYNWEVVIFDVLHKKVCDVSYNNFAFKWSRLLRSKIHGRQVPFPWKKSLVPDNQVVITINVPARAHAWNISVPILWKDDHIFQVLKLRPIDCSHNPDVSWVKRWAASENTHALQNLVYPISLRVNFHENLWQIIFRHMRIVEMTLKDTILIHTSHKMRAIANIYLCLFFKI